MAELESIGFFGKLPAYGDFIKRRAASNWHSVFDHWFREGLHRIQQVRGQRWEDDYRIAPAWRYLISKNLIGNQVVIGTWCPSYDRLGRLFPFATHITLQDDDLRSLRLSDIDDYLREVEYLSFVTRDDRLDVEQFDQQMQQLELIPSIDRRNPNGLTKGVRLSFNTREPLSDAVASIFLQQNIVRNRRFSLWWSAGTEEREPELFCFDALPDADTLGEFIPNHSLFAHELKQREAAYLEE